MINMFAMFTLSFFLIILMSFKQIPTVNGYGWNEGVQSQFKDDFSTVAVCSGAGGGSGGPGWLARSSSSCGGFALLD